MSKTDGNLTANEIASEFRFKFISAEWGSCVPDTEQKLAELLEQVWNNGATAATNVFKETGNRYDQTQIIPTFGVSKAELLRLNLIDP